MPEVPSRLVAYVGGVTAAAVATLVWATQNVSWLGIETWGPPAVLFLVLFAASERYPIRLVGRRDGGVFTSSAAFGFALLMVAPLQVALLAIAVGAFLGDAFGRERKAVVRVVFNVSQLTLSFAAGGLLLALIRGSTEVVASVDPSTAHVLALVPAGLAMYTANVLLTSIVLTLDQAAPIRAVLQAEFVPFDLLTHVLLLAFAPVLVIVWVHSPLLTPFLLAAIVAAFRATRAAVEGQYESRHDPLTGLPNRRLLDERLQELIDTAKGGGTFAVMAMDINGFKIVNDAFGHGVGDKLLIQIAERLTTVDVVDMVARTGGDEFALVLRRGLETDSLRRLGDRIVKLVSATYKVDELPLQVGASIGVARHLNDDDARSLLGRADSAMYTAKREGGGVRFETPVTAPRGPGRLSLVRDLERALEGRELRLEYQPQHSLSSLRVVGLEALLRWDHPRHGTIGPGQFIPTAEHTDLLPTLTRYVLDLAMQDARLRRSQGIMLPVSVNISARDLLDQRLSRDVGDLLSRYRYPAGDLTIEVTESALVADEARATQVLRELVDVGLNLSIDDFGTGYASLARLRDQPFTELKLDRSFVTTMISGAAGAAIVQAVIALARTLHLRVVAEGIEQQGQLEALTSHGCEDGQGFLLSRPLTGTALAQLLRDEPQIPLVKLPSLSRETVAVEVAS